MIDATNAYDFILAALCVWREARGETKEAKLGVAYTLVNRAAKPRWWGKSIHEVVLKPMQYSSFNHDDKNAVKWPSDDSTWKDCTDAVLEAMSGAVPDPTHGATHYHDNSIATPGWATTMEPKGQIGALSFYLEK